MKNGIRMIALLLVLGLLAGCGNGPISATDGSTEAAGSTGHHTPTNEATGGNDSQITVTCQYLPEKVDNPNNLPVLKWVCLTDYNLGGGRRTWNDTPVLELNQMLADRNMPFRIQFVLLTTNQRLGDNRKWFTFPEAQEALKEADLIYGDLTTEAITQYLAPITEHVTGTAQPSLKNAVAHDVNWLAGTVDGTVYGYGTWIYRVYDNAWTLDTALLEAAGLTAADFQKNYWELDEVFAKLFQANGERPFMYTNGDGVAFSNDYIGGQLSSWCPIFMDQIIPEYYDLVGSCFAVDYSRETPAVVNYLETDTIRRMQEAAVRYVSAGYYTNNPKLLDKQVFYGTMNVLGKYSSDNNYLYVIQSDGYFKGTGCWGLVSGVAAASDHKAEAISLLSLIAEDEVFRMQLFYGKEGWDYKVADGYYEIIRQQDGTDYSLDFISPLSYFSGLTSNPATSDMKSPGTENWGLIAQEGKTALETYQDSVDRSVRTYPIIFDYTGFEQEVEAMEKIFEKYFRIFTELTQTQYDQMLQELKAAGSDKILAELQRQLIQWQADHPDW